MLQKGGEVAEEVSFNVKVISYKEYENLLLRYEHGDKDIKILWRGGRHYLIYKGDLILKSEVL